ncbi:MAG TPA: TIM-barrel domain-containing protein [Polyangiaceae bacterium]
MKRAWLLGSFSAVLVATLVGACSSSSSGSAPPADDAGGPSCTRTDHDDLSAQVPQHTPRWAFEPWISKDISTRDDSYDYVNGFLSRDIPVGVLVLDSPWETFYNTFEPNPNRYGDFGPFVKDMHDKNVRMVLWVTGMTNVTGFDIENGGDTYDGPAPNYQPGADCNYYVQQNTLYFWWKGRGSGIDFFNQDATAWWHRQQDALFAYDIDGFKLDFAENYIDDYPVATAAGSKDQQSYSEAYYHDFIAYGVKARGNDFLTMTRAWDESYQFPGRFFAKKEDSRVAWMGDNRRDWIGLADALDEMMISAAAGYVVLGSDIGGYLNVDDKNLTGPVIPFDPVNFERWTAIGGLNPFMQLHSRSNLTPWTAEAKPDEITTVYRYWAKLHHAIVPFYYSLAEEQYGGHGQLMNPVGDPKTLVGDDRYVLGQAMLVAPLLDGTGKRSVPLPDGAKWYDYWNPGAAAMDGGTTVSADFSADPTGIPVYFREGAIVPMHVDDDVTLFGDASSKGALTVVVYPGAASSFVLHEDDDSTTEIDQKTSGTGFEIDLARAVLPTILRVRAETAPTSITQDGTALTSQASRAAFDAAPSGYFYDTDAKLAWVKFPAGGATKIVAQ